MRFPVMLEKETKKLYTVSFFLIFLAVFSAGDSFEEAKNNTEEAAELQQEEYIDSGETIPKPRDMEKVVKENAFDKQVVGFVYVYCPPIR